MPSSTLSDTPAPAESAPAESIDDRIVDAAARCVARWGLAKTTVDDVAREAGCARATIYRKFPGGRDDLFASMLRREEVRFLAEVTADLDRAVSLEDLLVAAAVRASRFIAGHEGLQYVIAHEPEQILPYVAFDRIQPLLDRVAIFAGPYLRPYLPADEVVPTAQWVTRLILSYALQPSPTVDLTDEAGARRFVTTYVLPGLGAVPRVDLHPNPTSITTRSTPVTTTENNAEDLSSLIGRADLNDLEAILSVTNTDVDAVVHSVKDNADAIFTWDYEKGARPALEKLYEKAKTSQWNGETDLDWSIEVDQESVVVANFMQNSDPDAGLGPDWDISGTVFEKWGDKEWMELGIQMQNWTLSQFMHGEQGALLCTAKIVESVPWIDAKYYAATQVMDEARHVEVFAKYLNTKLSGHYPINAHLRLLLDDIIEDSRWDMTYLGMQIMVEGLALAAFGFMHMMTTEELLKKLLRYVMSDEARHVAFGVLSLKEYYGELSAAEIRERQEFAFEAAVRMRDRFLQQEVWERLGVPVKEAVQAVSNAPEQMLFQQMLFSKIVPNCKKLGLLDASDGWLRTKFTELGVIQFEDWVDTGSEYEALDEVAKDRAASA